MYVPIPVLVLTFTWCSPFNPILWGSINQSHNCQHDITYHSVLGYNSPNLVVFIAKGQLVVMYTKYYLVIPCGTLGNDHLSVRSLKAS